LKIEGTYAIPAPREVVWQHLMNPDVLARSLPGCEKLEPNSDGSYQTELKISIAAVKGTYRGRVEILDLIPPERYRMKVQGQGSSGFVKGEGTLTLSDEGPAATKISYSGDAQVGGVIASVGQRLIHAAAHQMATHFFQELAKQVQPLQTGQV
jgi:carbon monoxide dehydrogenase subunit G